MFPTLETAAPKLGVVGGGGVEVVLLFVQPVIPIARTAISRSIRPPRALRVELRQARQFECGPAFSERLLRRDPRQANGWASLHIWKFLHRLKTNNERTKRADGRKNTDKKIPPHSQVFLSNRISRVQRNLCE
jgi:hypothetical protein